ncbi:hypothetical protein [Rhodobacter ferrooxidans]|uniref:AttH domain-containing protein n=1 Tax=Rhodobacter ferrooxidans TaxID=371731 RepID=C8RYX7_9RHOB|nr:hypothetical protein [Rhodobacter sp. SW2]EEW25934.1 hypothetical protein Rsw2DRAFT_1005 [Rhodobacter sp. SW2]
MANLHDFFPGVRLERSFRYTDSIAAPRIGLGPAGPFPNSALHDPTDRRWLHYAFLSRDGTRAMVANSSWLGPAEGEPAGTERFATILLLHDQGGWHSSQFNAETERPPWSAFTRPHGHGEAGNLRIAAASGSPAVDLALTRSSRPCTSQCAVFAGNQHLRWQSETGVTARGRWQTDGPPVEVDLVGYHERVRGRWGWPDLGEWVFGFANDLGGDPDCPPEWAGVFTFIRPSAAPLEATASFMLWHKGRMIRHFPRRCVSFAVRGEIDRDRVSIAPPLARLLGVPPAAPVPRRLAITARQGDDWLVLDFDADAAVRIVIPSETSLAAFSVHEVVGPCLLEGCVGGRRFQIESRGIVEFSGGAAGDAGG